jgi:DNA mismatch repair protein MutS
MTLIGDYNREFEKYQKKYGKKTMFLMQCGSFFEVYSCKKDGIFLNNTIEDFSRICDMRIANKKCKHKGLSVFMSGFPEVQIEKYIHKLNNAGYTVAVWVQEPTNPKIRKEHGIFSPGTNFDLVQSEITNKIMTIWIEMYPKTILNKKPRIVTGISCIDIISGDVYTFENCEEYFHNPITFDEVERFYSSYRPKELIIIHNCENDKIKDIISYADIDSNLIHEFNITTEKGEWKKYIENCSKETYHEAQLSKYYNITDYDAFYDSYKLRERKFSTQSLVFLLNFLDIHNHNLVQGLKYPDFVNIDDRLRLANHSLKQLNIIKTEQNGRYSSLEKIVNLCKTSMGKRFLRNKLLNPTCYISYLKNEYEIQDYTSNNIEWENLYNQLNRVTDLERLYRKTILVRVAPSDLSNLYDNLKVINKLIKQLKIDEKLNNYLITEFLSKFTKKLQQKIKHSVDLSKSSNISSIEFDENIFKRSIDEEKFKRLDKAEFIYFEKIAKLEAIRKYLDGLIVEKGKKQVDKVKYHKTEKSGTFLVITSTRWSKMYPKISNKPVKLTYKVFEEEYTYDVDLSDIEKKKATGSSFRIESSEILELYGEILTKKAIFKEILMAVYRDYIISFQQFKTEFLTIINFIQKTDFLLARVKLFNEFNYCKPEIIDNQDQSYFIAKDIRHPLIEHIQDKEIYVPNDISLGVENEETGICLYGTNAVGKSSLIRSIGMCIVLAQAGFYVPCSSFTYKPYTAIYTRILGNDNIFKGLSTFAVEMSELGSILRGANKNTLVLGDELCTGTETTSAFCIIQAGLVWLHQRNASFIFATHFHELAEKKEIKRLERLKMKHMVVEHDEERGCLVYYRKLKDGNGSRLYGLEVCKSMPMPREFLDLANSFRYKNIDNEKLVLSNKGSRYNTKKLKDNCELCGAKGEDIHHMIPQNKANKKGFVGSVHKNHKANLMNICKECHENVTKNNIIHKKVKTTKGNTFIEINM